MKRLGWGVGGGGWRWRQVEENLVQACHLLLLNVVLQLHVADRWRWNLDLTNAYTVSEAYY
jgi:hypothetical protein